MKISLLHPRSFSRIHFSVFRHRWTKNCFTGPKSFRGFQDTGPRSHNQRDGDCKRALILLLGLSPWCGTIFLFLEQIAPSPVAHARTCCEDFCILLRGGIDVRNHRNVWYFWPTRAPNSIRSCLLEFCSSIFVVGWSSLSEVRQCWI